MSKHNQETQPAVPRHVAIIMDGNNRWAKKRLLPGVAGHKAASTRCGPSSRYASSRAWRC